MSVPIAGHNARTLLTGTCQAGGSATTAKLPASFSAVDSTYVGQSIQVTGGACAAQTAVISAYVGATRIATFAPAMTGGAPGPDATSVFVLAPAGTAPSAMGTAVKTWASLPMV